MNALANSQREELEKFIEGCGLPDDLKPTFERYTGQESDADRRRIAADPPDIILTNFMMLELLMTRQDGVDRDVIGNMKGLAFLVLDELHTYRGRQGADVAMLVRRVRERLGAEKMLCIGTSATMASGDEDGRGTSYACCQHFSSELARQSSACRSAPRIAICPSTSSKLGPLHFGRSGLSRRPYKARNRSLSLQSRYPNYALQ